MCKAWAFAPDRLTLDPIHQMPGPSAGAAARRDHLPARPAGAPAPLRSPIRPASRRPDLTPKEDPPVSKDKNRGNRETKKPKKEKPKVSATANSGAAKADTVIGGKKIK